MDVVASGVVLAGGAGRRMGRDKRTIEVDGRPLLRRAIDALAAVCAEVLVVGSPRQPDVDLSGARSVFDRRADAGPLAGLETGLIEARHDLVLVLAGDHPGARPAVLHELLARLRASPETDVVALGTERGPQPLVAAYRRDALGRITHLLDGGERRARTVVDVLTATVVAEPEWRSLDPDGATAVDVDTPTDLAAWERRDDHRRGSTS